MAKKLILECQKSIKENFLPGLILQAFALILVVLYYQSVSVNDFFNNVADVKAKYGYSFSAISTAIFGGFIPYLYILYRGKIPRNHALAHGLFYCIFWFLKGIEVDLFYRFQAFMFGTGNDFKTIANKVLFDQFCYNLLYAAASMTLIYIWKDCNFSWTQFKKQVNKETFTITIPSVLVSTWLIWLPATALIYSLPASLQVPLFNLVLCFFVLIVTTLCDETSKQNMTKREERNSNM